MGFYIRFLSVKYKRTHSGQFSTKWKEISREDSVRGMQGNEYEKNSTNKKKTHPWKASLDSFMKGDPGPIQDRLPRTHAGQDTQDLYRTELSGLLSHWWLWITLGCSYVPVPTRFPAEDVPAHLSVRAWIMGIKMKIKDGISVSFRLSTRNGGPLKRNQFDISLSVRKKLIPTKRHFHGLTKNWRHPPSPSPRSICSPVCTYCKPSLMDTVNSCF